MARTNPKTYSAYTVPAALACPAERGDVLFFSYLTIHGSKPNRSDQVRKTVLVQLRDPTDRPTVDTHRSHGQGLMLRGIDPLESSGEPNVAYKNLPPTATPTEPR